MIGWKRLGYQAGHQEVDRCRTRVDLRNSLQLMKQTGSAFDFKTRADEISSSNQVSAVPQKDYVLQYVLISSWITHAPDARYQGIVLD